VTRDHTRVALAKLPVCSGPLFGSIPALALAPRPVTTSVCSGISHATTAPTEADASRRAGTCTASVSEFQAKVLLFFSSFLDVAGHRRADHHRGVHVGTQVSMLLVRLPFAVGRRVAR
jgi:hypothetical protein